MLLSLSYRRTSWKEVAQAAEAVIEVALPWLPHPTIGISYG